MKVCIVFLLFVYTVSAISLSKEFVATKWKSFKSTFNKQYDSHEESSRSQIFQKNLERFEAHNEKYKQGLVKYTLGVNKFSDRTAEEMKSYFPPIAPPETLKPVKQIKSRQDLGIVSERPASLDWRDHGIVTPVKYQDMCGSCWAFSAAGAIESHVALTYGTFLDTSEQQLVDCSEKSLGCEGGWMMDAFEYIAQTGGLDSETGYPYKATNSTCRFKSDQVVAKLTGYVLLKDADEDVLADTVATKGPVSVAFDSSGDFPDYSGGIYYNATCSQKSFGHAVLIVGYGTEDGQDYWLIKNSWGDWWGIDGYAKMARNADNQCGIASYPSYPVLDTATTTPSKQCQSKLHKNAAKF